MKIVALIKEVASSWSAHNISTMAAALAYYTLFSLTPILLISLNLLVLILNEDLVRNSILNHIQELFGADTSTQIQLMITKASQPMTHKGHIISWIFLIIGSSALFTELQSGLNRIWGVITNPDERWFTIIKQRLLSFIMVLVVVLLLFLSLILSIVTATMSTYISRFFNVGTLDFIILHTLSFFTIVLLFAMIFKILPDVKIKWRNVWIGAIITTLLFSLGKYVLAIYFSSLHVASMYGAAGSLIILLIWVFYSAQIFFIGAEITKVISLQKHETIKPKHEAWIVEPPAVHQYKAKRKKIPRT